MSSYRKDVHVALAAKITAALALGQPLAFVAPGSFFKAAYPDFHALPPDAYPAIMLMPDRGREKFFTTGDPPAVLDGFLFKLVIAQQEGDAGSGAGFLGDAALNPPLVGLYDFESAIKDVIETDQSLGGAAGGRVQKVLCTDDDYKYDYYPTVMQEIIVMVTGQLTTRSH